MFETYIALAIIISLIFEEITDLSPGGLITPGYIALYLDQPDRLLSTLIISLICYAILRLGRKWLPLYGKRQFTLAVTVALLLNLLFSSSFLSAGSLTFSLHSVGIIVPGLIAHSSIRQGGIRTALSLVLVSGALFALLLFLKGFSL